MTSARSKPRKDGTPIGKTLARAAAALAILAGFVYLALTAPNALPGRSYLDISAEFVDAKGITQHSDVWIAGRRVGQVLQGRAQGGHAVLPLRLDEGVAVPVDSTARIRQSSLLGARAVELVPGRSKDLIEDGGRIALSRTSSETELPEVLSALDAPRRRALQTTVRQLGVGFLGRGRALNDALDVAPDFFAAARLASEGVLARPGAAERFFPALERAAAAADPVRRDIARGFEPQHRVFAALAAERAALDRLLRVAPESLSGVRVGLSRSDPLLSEAAGFARAAEDLARPAPASLREARALLREAGPTLRRTAPVLRDARATVPRVLGLTRRVDPRIPEIREGIANPVPLFERISAHGCDLALWSKNWRSMLAFAPPGSPSNGAGQEPNVGPLNVLRVQFESFPGSSQSVGGSPPPIRAVSAYPAPCTSVSERTP